MGTLQGVRIVEMAGLGPVPFAAMMLADMGADIVRIDPPTSAPSADSEDIAWMADRKTPIWRGRSAIQLDLKDAGDRERALSLIAKADVVLEGFRPGVMERLGLGPTECQLRNDGLVYARMTGWGQTGPLKHAAGHDVNYLALSGALRYIAREGERPLPPLNLLADFGGGGMLLVVGVLSALLERVGSGKGQTVDATMLDGTALLMTSIMGWMDRGSWTDPPGTNVIDTGAPFYEVYTTKDGRHMAFGSVEPKFYRELVDVLGIDPDLLAPQFDRSRWPAMKLLFAEAVASRTFDEWVDAFDGTQACATGVFSMEEAAAHPHNVARCTYIEIDGVLQPAPSPRFDRTPSKVQEPRSNESTQTVLERWSSRE
jgi:alpha-methylacyl-CoA racemase